MQKTWKLVGICCVGAIAGSLALAQPDAFPRGLESLADRGRTVDVG